MKEKLEAKLKVNKISVDMNPFVEEFLARTTTGAIAALRGAENIQELEVHQEKGNVRVIVDGNEISLTPFPNDIIASTLIGLVSSLKGVDDVNSLDISVRVG